MYENHKNLMPDVYQFESFFEYLKAIVYHFHKTKFGPKTNGEWALRLGYKSPRSFGMITSGERLPSNEMISSLSKYLKLSKRKEEYLRLLVTLEKKRKKNKPINTTINQLKEINPKNSSFHFIEPDEFSHISKWYYLVLRQILIWPYHESEIHTLHSLIGKQIKLRTLKNALELMIAHGFLKRDQDGFISIAKQGLNTRSDIPSHAVIQHHLEMLDQTKKHLVSDQPEEREFQSLTFRCKATDMKEAKEFIRDFKEEFNKRFAKDNGEDVYQLGIQFFSHTKSFQNEGKKDV